MGLELKILKELSAISCTSGELLAITDIVTTAIGNQAFLARYAEVNNAIMNCYGLIEEILHPFTLLDSPQAFSTDFQPRLHSYREQYLHLTGKVRRSLDEAYEEYLELQRLKEMKTTYPLLMSTFSRLDDFVDKWVTNDAWLAMGTDTILKLLVRWLNELGEFHRRDYEEAYMIYCPLVRDMGDYLAYTKARTKRLA